MTQTIPLPAAVVNCAAYGPAGRKDIPLPAISDAIADPDLFVWVGLYEPDDAILETMREEFDLHELAIEDARHAHQRPKVENYGDVVFVVLHTAQMLDGELRFGETHLFVGKNFLLCVRHGASIPYATVRTRCEHSPMLREAGPAFALYAVMDFVIDQFAEPMDACHRELARLESEIFSGQFKRETIKQLYRLGQQLMDLRMAALPLQDVCQQLMRMHTDIVTDSLQPYFRDVFDHAKRIGSAIDRLRESVNAAVQVNLALVSVGQNEIVKRLAGWAAVLAVPTMMASFWGMNFASMPELQMRFGYPLAVCAMLLASGLLYRRLKRSGWL